MNRSLGQRLKEAREITRLTQQQVADKLGISNGTLSGYERNYRDPDTDTLNRLAALYEVSVDYLLGRTADPTRINDPEKKDSIPAALSEEEAMFLEVVKEIAAERHIDITDPVKRRKLIEVAKLVFDYRTDGNSL